MASGQTIEIAESAAVRPDSASGNPPANGVAARLRDRAALIAGAAFVAAMVLVAWRGGEAKLAIYALSFWHYYLYALAYCFGAVSLRVFKRDAAWMKTVALVALGTVYLAAPLDIVSLAVVASGFLLNIVAALALGSDRTYYGYELADLPPRRITAFPYSVMSHPMLLGNMLAFGGTLINAGFREHWWPLAAAHVALNLGVLVMEVAIRPRCLAARDGMARGSRMRSFVTGLAVVAGGAATGAVFAWDARSTDALLYAGAGAGMATFAYVIYRVYSSPQAEKRRALDRQGGYA